MYTIQTNLPTNLTTTTFPTTTSNQGITHSEFGSPDTSSCHENIDEYENLRKETRFWLEGILLLIVGIVGITGNSLSILVLPGCAGNRDFNILLM